MGKSTRLVIKGDKAKVFETLTDINGVVSVRFEREEEGLSYLTVYSENLNEVKESILNRLTEQRIPIYAL